MDPLEKVLERIESWFVAQKPFVIYSKPEESLVKVMLQRNSAVHKTNFRDEGFIFSMFDENDNIFIPSSESEIFYCECISANTDHERSNSTINESEKDRKAFIAIVDEAIAAIRSGVMDKVVLSRKIVLKIHRVELSALIIKLLESFPSAFRYCFFHPSAGIWIGATPELLVKINGNQFKTVALAGTQKYQASEDVVWKEKEKNEQQFVTDFITEGLRPVADHLKVSAPLTKKASNLIHIKSEIEGEMKPGTEIRTIINILHPTPAVCGFPRDMAMKFILENEGYDREYYTGYLGEFYNSGNSADLYVNLRCMKIVNDDAHLYVGCGITKDSNAGDEYTETVNKSMTIKKILTK